MSLASGTRLGPYEILAPLGAGGMGEVYRARDTRLGRDVAIKVLAGHRVQSRAALSRFEREAKAVAALSHPNVLALYDVGDEGGISYAVTELLEGETLRARLERAALPWRQAVEIAVSVANGLAAAHDKGVIHRDLKPANIFLTAGGPVKILDFGLARVKSPVPAADESCAPTETGAGTVLGTVGYMSPEQVRGERADFASDIFSFGCVLYEMLAGRRAFARQTPAQTMAAILDAEPPPLAGGANQVPAGLERVLARCLEKDPRRRFQSAHDLAFALRSVEDPGSSAGAGKPERPRMAWIAAALALMIAAAAFYWWNRSASAIDSLAILPFANEGADPNQEYLSDGITESLINSLSGVPRLRVTARSLAFRYRGPQVNPQQAGRDLGVRAVLTGRVRERDGALNVQAELMKVADGAQLWGGQYDRKSFEILALQQELARTVAGKLNLKPGAEHEKRLAKRSTENTEAYQLYLRGRYHWNRRTEQALKRAAEYFRQAIDKDPGYALAYAGLADCYAVYNSYQVELPRESGPKAKAAAARALEIDGTLAEAHASLGMTRMSYEWDWAGAERDFRRAIELNPDYATAHHWYAICLSATGRSDEALASLERAQRADPLSLIIIADIGMVLHFARRYDEAIGQLRKVFEMDPGFNSGHRHLGMAFEQKGMYPEAIAEFEKSLEVARNPFSLGSLGHAYAVSGNREKALQTLAEVRELSQRRYVPPFAAALIHTGLGDKERALEWLEKSLDDRSLETIFLSVDPRFDRLRSDPRFAGLLRRMGLGR